MRRPTAIPAALLGALALFAAGCGGDPRPDVLLITVDTLRADYLGSMGYPRPTSPNMDCLASQGLLFERHYSTSSQTGPSHASIFSGLMPSEHGLVKNGTAVPADIPWLADEFSAGGWSTGAVVGALVVGKRFGYDRGFDFFDDDMRSGRPRDPRDTGAREVFERDASRVVDVASAWLAGAGSAPVFLWVHVFDPHEPYSPPEPAPLSAAGAEGFFRTRAEPSRLFDVDQLVPLLAGYEAEVSYTDVHIGRLVAAFDARDRDSVVILTSDHGEGLGEHAYQGHHFYLYEEQVHVPLVVRGRGAPARRLPAGTRVAALTSATELAEALREWANIPSRGGRTTLPARALDPRPDPAARALLERAHLSSFDLEIARPLQRILEHLDGQSGGARGLLRGLVAPDYKYMESDDVAPEFYDLDRDPAEARNLANGAETARVAAAAAELANARGALATRTSAPSGDTDPEVRRMLDALGY